MRHVCNVDLSLSGTSLAHEVQERIFPPTGFAAAAEIDALAEELGLADTQRVGQGGELTIVSSRSVPCQTPFLGGLSLDGTRNVLIREGFWGSFGEQMLTGPEDST